MQERAALPENYPEGGAGGIAAVEIDGAVVVAHDLAGQRQADAGAFFLGGEERHEDLLLALHRDGVFVKENNLASKISRVLEI